jgi:hypothetical protein
MCVSSLLKDFVASSTVHLGLVLEDITLSETGTAAYKESSGRKDRLGIAQI